MRTLLKYLTLVALTIPMNACVTTVKTKDVRVDSLKELTVDYKTAPSVYGEGFFYNSIKRGRHSSNDQQSNVDSFYQLSFTSINDLIERAEKKDTLGLSYWISECAERKKTKDSRYFGRVFILEKDQNTPSRYFVFIPSSLRKEMDRSASVAPTSYDEYMKNAIATDTEESLCVFIGAFRYVLPGGFQSNLGSLSDLGISLDN